jgi:hypothetical protein
MKKQIDYEHDAPSFYWKIIGYYEDDRLFEAENFVYHIFHLIYKRARKELIEEIKKGGTL